MKVELARYPDRDLVIHALRAQGYAPRAVDADGVVGVEIPCGGDEGRACEELLHELETIVGDLDVPFVPVQGDGFIFLRPPGD